MNSYPLTTIIVNYRTCGLLRDCLESIRRNGPPGMQTVVVDNHSSDGSVAMVQREFPETRLIINRENLGFAKANNQAIRQSTSRYLLLLNSDTVVLPGALQAMVEFMDQHAETGGVACRLRYADGSIQRTMRRTDSGTGLGWLFWRLSELSSLLQGDKVQQFVRRYLGFALGSTLRAYLDSYEGDSSPTEAAMLSGACLLLRRKAVDEVGLLDEKFFMYMEDVDYCMRLTKAGWHLYYLPAAEIIHLGEQSSGGRMRKYKVAAYRSLFYFYRKHCPAWKLPIARLLVFVAFCLRWTWNLVRATVSGNEVYRQNCSDIAAVLRLCYESDRQGSPSVSVNAGDNRSAGSKTSCELEKEELRA